jgi:histidyl-tRNA synthetase
MEFRTPLGMRDLSGKQLAIKDKIINVARAEFKKYGAIELDTPIMEHFSAVTQLYGDEFNKLVYGLSDSKDDQAAPVNNVFLRYDLTLPFARYVRMNNIKQIRRYQIGKVYRKDDPQISKGRFREFTQCDFDICGPASDTRISEFEVLAAFDAILNKLISNKYIIKINDRRFIEELLASFEIEEKDFQTVTTILDKLDKHTAAEIKQELIDKMIKPSSVELIFTTIKELAQISEDVDKIKYFEDKKFSTIGLISEVIQLGISANIKFDPWIIRGLDYYTGLIFEAGIKDLPNASSVGGGGVYNKLLPAGMESIGMSIGVDRLAAYVEANIEPVDVLLYVGTIGSAMTAQRFKLAKLLRDNGYSVYIPIQICFQCVVNYK